LSLKQKTISGVKWTTLSTVIVTLVQLAQLAILARFLNPTDFGLMALVMVVIGFSQAFLDMGISNAIIHKQKITHEQLSTLYWVNVLAGVVLFVVICAVAPFVASFYHESELIKLTILVGITFLIQPFGQQFMVLWQKEMRFREIAKIDIINKLISFVASVWFAYDGYGVYALVYGTIVASVVSTLQYMILGLREHRPSFIFRPSEIKEFMSFGAYQMGERTINYFNYQIDTMLIGKLLGMEALGIYNIAKQLIMRPAQVFNPIITKVTFPAMAKIQDDLPKLKEVYLKTINYLSSVNFPVYAFIFIFANDITFVLFGVKWLAAVPIIQILSIWGALRSTGNPVGSLLLARGKANWGFWWNLGLFFYVPVGIYVGSHWGLVGISWVLIALQFSLTTPNWYFLVKPLCGAGFVEYHMQIFKPALIAMVAGFGAYVGVLIFDSIWIKFTVGIGIGLGLSYLINKNYNEDFFSEIKGLIK
jgi:O-antigen/teichoic acid export membrane protein